MENLDFNRQIPGMIEPGEQRYLHDLVLHSYKGTGEIVEIGALAGLSTSALAEGLRLNERAKEKDGRIHVYDTFTFPTGKLEKVFRQTLGQSEGGEFRNAFDYYTREWTRYLTVHQGDALLESWCGKPIEILFVDCAAGLDFHMAIAHEFYPHVALEGFLIHQDWFYNRSWYLPAIMRAHGFQFAPIASVGTSRIFQRRTVENYKIHKPNETEILDALLKEIALEREPEHRAILVSALLRFARHLSPAVKSNLLDALDEDT